MKHHEVVDFGRNELVKAGYETHKRSKQFCLFSFHGIGLGPFHDPPDSKHKDMVLEPGMTFSLQPAVRNEEFTIRFEDNGLITEDGVELLTSLSRELI